jgi:ppGpp synthetase/RelA/SpoT-type nucleotidyltranferase
MSDNRDSILREYDERHSLYRQFNDKLRPLLQDLVGRDAMIHLHSINGRIKDRESLAKKIQRKSYARLDDITDICGIRIITYYDKEVDSVARIIEREFEVDPDNSVDKRKKALDTFGYLSSHYIVRLRPVRLQLPEYEIFSSCQAEIQIRSIIQHAWAEIEHDLGYKSQTAVPPPVRRQFFRLAALLELADNEFTRLKEEITGYEQQVSEKLESRPEELYIDNTSLSVFIKQNHEFSHWDKRLADLLGAQLIDDADIIPIRVAELQALELETLKDVETALTECASVAYRFAELWIGNKCKTEIPLGTFLLYLCYCLAAVSENENEVAANLRKINVAVDAGRVIETYRLAVQDTA